VAGGAVLLVCLILFVNSFALMYESSFPDFGVPGNLVGSVLLVDVYIHGLRVDGDGIYGWSLTDC